MSAPLRPRRARRPRPGSATPRARGGARALTGLLCVSLAGAAVALATACAARTPPGAATDPAPMGSWSAWQSLEPLVEVARHQTDTESAKALSEATTLLVKGKARSADELLRRHATGPGRHWIAVGRANVLALHFTVCVRGVAWRLEDLEPGTARERRVEQGPEARLGPADISVEATLTNLDDALTAGNPALVTQARIARARMTSFVVSCPPNEAVAELAEGHLRADLATLAAHGQLTPDLAYVWAGIQMQEYSGAAARPFLEQARAGGFDDPSVDYLLAVIALELRDFEGADRLATEAASVYEALGDAMQASQAWFIRGEAARESGEQGRARQHYREAMERHPAHAAALLGLVRVELDAKGEIAATDTLVQGLPDLLGREALDAEGADRAARNLEALVMLTDGELALSELLRDAMTEGVDLDEDPLRRGLRYFYAATLDARLGDYERARGRAAVALGEFEESELPPPVDARKFLDRL